MARRLTLAWGLHCVVTEDAHDLDDVVIDVFSAGYGIGSRLIQPARVVIGKLQHHLGSLRQRGSVACSDMGGV